MQDETRMAEEGAVLHALLQWVCLANQSVGRGLMDL